MRNLHLALLLVILFLSPLVALGQTGRLYGTDEGLSSSFANQVFQDSRGFIWVPTRNGLNVFDGYSFTVFNQKSSAGLGLNTNNINKVSQDRQGNILLGTNKGLLLYDGHQFHAYTLLDDSRRPVLTYVTDILVRRNGSVLISTSGYGVRQAVGGDGHRKCLGTRGALGRLKFIKQLMEDPVGNLWVVTEDSRVYCQRPDGRMACAFAGSNSQAVNTITADRIGNIYLGTTEGVWVRRRGSSRFEPVDAIGKMPVWSLFVSPTGRLFVGCDGFGLKVYDPTTQRLDDNPFYTNRIDLTRAKVNAIIQDRQGNIWMSMLQKGVFMQPKLSFDFGYIGYKANNANSIGGNCVTSVLIARGGQLWVGTDRDGLYQLGPDGKLIRHYSTPATVEALAEDHDGRVWVGTYREGYGYVQGGAYHSLEKSPELSVFDIKMDAQGNKWLATLGSGIIRLGVDGSRKTYTMDPKAETNDHVNSLANNFVIKMAFSRDCRRLYVATAVGLCCLDLPSQSWTKTFGTNLVDSDNYIYYVFEDRHGRVWVGTDDGLFCHDRTHWVYPRKYTDEQGLPDNSVAFISQDRRGRMWLGTQHGLCCLDAQTGKTQNFFVGNGLQGNEFSDGAVSLSADGHRMLIGGPGGANVFDPNRMAQKAWNAVVSISGFIVNGAQVQAGMKSGWYTVTNQPAPVSDHFELSYDDNTFSIELTTLTYNNVEQVSYSYSINDEAWKTLTQGQNVLSFAHLPAGTYHFRVRALYNGQSSAVQTFTIVVHPAWYASLPARLVYLLLVVLAAWLYLAYLHRKEKERLVLQEHIHTEEMGEAKLRFFVNISHDIRTPLTLILTPLLSLIKDDKDPKRQNTYALMRRNAERILHLVNQIMDLRKIDKGKMVMRMQRTDMVAFVEDEYQLFQQQAAIKNITFEYHHDSDALPVWIDRDNFDKVVMNLLSNAFKFTPAGGRVTITVSHSDTDAVIEVRDSGCGIPKDKLETIFQRFYQTPTGMGERNNGTGIGLDLTRSLVELHYGTITAQNNSDGPGACFTVTLPLGNSHLKPDEMLADDGSLVPTPITEKEMDIETETIPSAVAKADDKATGNGKRPRVVVVEDDDEIAEYLKRELADAYSVTHYPNGKVALAAILQATPDLVISDVMMPEMDGITLCTKLKNNINTNDIPVILLTAKTRDEDRMEGLETGADAYIAKPFNMDILRHTITNLLAVRRTLRNKFSGQESQDDKVENVDVQNPDDKFLQRVMDIINKNIGDSDLGVDDIADQVGISRVHLYRKMKELTNQTPHNFIKNLRLKQAARLLADPRQSVTEVMYACGFSNSASFSTMFKNMYGLSPREYQRKKTQGNL